MEVTVTQEGGAPEKFKPAGAAVSSAPGAVRKPTGAQYEQVREAQDANAQNLPSENGADDDMPGNHDPSHLIKVHEQHLIHARITGVATRRDGTPVNPARVQSFTPQSFEMQKTAGNFNGYRVEILHHPTEVKRTVISPELQAARVAYLNQTGKNAPEGHTVEMIRAILDAFREFGAPTHPVGAGGEGQAPGALATAPAAATGSGEGNTGLGSDADTDTNTGAGSGLGTTGSDLPPGAAETPGLPAGTVPE